MGNESSSEMMEQPDTATQSHHQNSTPNNYNNNGNDYDPDASINNHIRQKIIKSNIIKSTKPIRPINSSWTIKPYEDFVRTYSKDSLLGEGGFGQVFAGRRLSDDLPVAVKEIDAEKVPEWAP